MEKEKLIVTIRVPFSSGRPVFLQSKSYGENVATLQRYRMALEREIQAAAEELEDYDIQTVHIADGSMGLFGPGTFDDFLRALRKALPAAKDAQWTIDMMPGDFSQEMLVGLKNGGIDAVNLILPAGNKAELAQTKSPFTMNVVDYTMRFIRQSRMPEISIETLVGVPGQTPESLQETLAYAMQISPVQIHLRKFTNNRLLPGEEKRLEEETDWAGLYAAADTWLTGHGMAPYGADHCYAVPGRGLRESASGAEKISRMGFGVGAVTRIEGLSYHNTFNLKLYMEKSDDPSQIARLDS